MYLLPVLKLNTPHFINIYRLLQRHMYMVHPQCFAFGNQTAESLPPLKPSQHAILRHTTHRSALKHHQEGAETCMLNWFTSAEERLMNDTLEIYLRSDSV